MNFSKIIEMLYIKLLAFLITLLISALFLFCTIYVPSIVISYLFRLSLIRSIILYLLCLLVFKIKSKLKQDNLKTQEYTPLEEVLD